MRNQNGANIPGATDNKNSHVLTPFRIHSNIDEEYSNRVPDGLSGFKAEMDRICARQPFVQSGGIAVLRRQYRGIDRPCDSNPWIIPANSALALGVADGSAQVL